MIQADKNRRLGCVETPESRGKEGEELLHQWLQDEGISYVYVRQEPSRFAPLFKDELKRPDFLVLLESIGLLAVDAKYCSLSNFGNYTLSTDELRKASMFERIFRIPVWYAFVDQEDAGNSWLWISLLKAIEVGREHASYYSIHPDHFEVLESNADLGKLYTHRLPSLKNLKRITP